MNSSPNTTPSSSAKKFRRRHCDTMYDYGDLLGLSYTTTTTNATATTTDFLGYDPREISIPSSTTAYPIPLSPSPLVIPTHDHQFDSALTSLKSEVGYSSSSSYGSPSSLPNCYQLQRPNNLVQRSLSSHSLQKVDDYGGSFYHHHHNYHHHHHHPIFSSLEESRREILDLDTGPMRKVYSTGDLEIDNTTLQQHGRSQSPLSQEVSCTIEGMNKVGRYSSEERKERIERYRSKRHQRNFTKKIKYACRKTLADSRPRIRGRFARNEEMGESSCSQTQWSQIGVDEDEEDDDVLISLLCQFNSLE